MADPGFSPGGAPTPKSAIIFQFFTENCMKMKEFGPGGASLAPPFDPPMTYVQLAILHSAPFIGGSRGGVRDAHPPPGRPNSFDFMQFSGKFGVFTPPLEGSRPPSGKSWIRHCHYMLQLARSINVGVIGLRLSKSVIRIEPRQPSTKKSN